MSAGMHYVALKAGVRCCFASPSARFTPAAS